MTKKSLAALMLAGAMMTVGSGAMAATEINNTTTAPEANVTVKYDASEVIDLTVSWEDVAEIKYEWKNGVWTAPAASTLTFAIANKGSKAKKLEFAQDAEGQPDWLTVESTAPSADVNAPTGETAGSGSVVFTLTPQVVSGVGNNKVTNDLKFSITVSDVQSK